MKILHHSILLNSAGSGGSSNSGSILPPKKNILEADPIPPNKLELINRKTEELPCDEPVTRTFKAPECQRIHKIYRTNPTGIGYEEIPITNKKEMTITFPDMKTARNIRVIYTNDSVAISVRSGIGGRTDKDNTSPKICRGKDFEITITPQEGYEVDFVTNNNSPISGWNPKGGKMTFSNVQNPMNIEVAFKRKSFTVTVNIGSGGSATPRSATVYYGENFTFNIVPNSGYRVKSLTSNGSILIFSKTGGPITITNVRENKTLNLQFEVSSAAVTITQSGSGSVSPTGTQQVAIGSNFSIRAQANQGSVLLQVSVNGQNRSFSSATGSNTISLSNVSSDTNVHFHFITLRQSLGYITYPSNQVLMPVAYKNNGLMIHKSFRSGDNTTQFHLQGFGVFNPVTNIMFLDGPSTSAMSSKSLYGNTRSDYRDKMRTDPTNQYHRVIAGRADRGYFDATGRAERQGGRDINTRTVRVYLSNVINGSLEFTVTSGATDSSGNFISSGHILNMTINGQSLPVLSKSGSQIVRYGVFSPGTYRVRVTMRLSNEYDVFYCEGTYVISL